jgi:hypothetical protein
MYKKGEKFLTSLCAQIEEAWLNDRNSNLAERLAVDYPEHADELFAFLELLLFADLDGEALLETTQIRADAEQSKDWLEREGYDLAASIAKAENDKRWSSTITPAPVLALNASNTLGENNEHLISVSSTPRGGGILTNTTFLIAMKKETGKRGTEVANLLGVTYPFLLEASRYPTILPRRAKCELVDLAEQRCGVSSQISWQAFENRPIELRIAKHRTRSLPGDLPSYVDIVQRSGMNEEQQRFWLSMFSEDER